MARPLTHLTHGISTRRPFHPANLRKEEAWPEPCHPYQQHPVATTQPRTLRSTPQGNIELMPKKDVLYFKPVPRLEHVGDKCARSAPSKTTVMSSRLFAVPVPALLAPMLQSDDGCYRPGPVKTPIRMIWTALPITSAARRSPLGPRGITHSSQ